MWKFWKNDEYVSCHECLGIKHSLIFVSLIIINIALFIVVEIGVLGSDNVEIVWTSFEIAGFEFKGGSMLMDTMYSFSMGSTLRLMFGAEGIWTFTAIMMLILSGIVPFVRLFTLLFIWFVRMPTKMREWALYLVDITGKSQFLNFYLMFMIGSAVGLDRTLTFNVPADAPFSMPEISIRLTLKPYPLLFLFIFAIIFSIALPQHAVSMHYWFTYGTDTSRRTGRVFKDKYPNNYLALAIVTVLSLAMAGLFIWAMIGDMFVFTYGGLAGPILVPQNNHTIGYSLLKIGYAFPSQVYYSYNFGAFLLSVVFYFLCVVGPIFLGIALVYNWYAAVFNFSSLWRRRALRFCQFASAWTACEVFLASFGVGTANMNSLLHQVTVVSAETMPIPQQLIDIAKLYNISLPDNMAPILNDVCGPTATINLTTIIEDAQQLPIIGEMVNLTLEELEVTLPLDQSLCMANVISFRDQFWALFGATFCGYFGAMLTAYLLQPKTVEIDRESLYKDAAAWDDPAEPEDIEENQSLISKGSDEPVAPQENSESRSSSNRLPKLGQVDVESATAMS